MKNKVLFTLSICTSILLSVNATNAQEKLPLLSIKNIDFVKIYVSKFYKPDESFIANGCINSVIYVKFKIDKFNRVDSVDVSTNGPSEIKNALRKAILATNGYWRLTEEEKKQIVNRYFIPPFAFNYQSGCSSGIVLRKNDPRINEFSEKTKNLNGEIYKSVSSMLRFESGSYGAINCILISPMMVGSIN